MNSIPGAENNPELISIAVKIWLRNAQVSWETVLPNGRGMRPRRSFSFGKDAEMSIKDAISWNITGQQITIIYSTSPPSTACGALELGGLSPQAPGKELTRQDIVQKEITKRWD